jgi:hypothetical protein
MKTQLTIITAVLMLFLAGIGLSLSQADVTLTNSIPTRMLNGTIDGIDALERLVTIQSEKKDTWMFIAVSNGELLKGLNRGDRVVVELDEQGVAQKINKTVPNLKTIFEDKG